MTDLKELIDYVISQYEGVDVNDLQRAELNILKRFEQAGLVIKYHPAPDITYFKKKSELRDDTN
jgi:hypothetical protein